MTHIDWRIEYTEIKSMNLFEGRHIQLISLLIAYRFLYIAKLNTECQVVMSF